MNEDQATIRAAHYNSDHNVDNEQNVQLFRTIHQGLLDAGNSYLLLFISVNEYIEAHGLETHNVRVAIHADICPNDAQHLCQYNLPKCSEVSILMPNTIALNETRYLICTLRNDPGNNSTISDTHRSYDPRAYPLFYPLGADRWSLRYRIATRSNQSISSCLSIFS
jgi:hypothetical protein